MGSNEELLAKLEERFRLGAISEDVYRELKASLLPCSQDATSQAEDEVIVDTSDDRFPQWGDFVDEEDPTPETPAADFVVPNEEQEHPLQAPEVSRPLLTLHKAAALGRLDDVKQHIQCGSDVNVRDDRGATPLHWAVYNAHREIVELILSCRPDLNAAALDGVTPLTLALTNKTLDIAQLLVNCGADIRLARESERTALTRAVGQGQLEVVRWLLDHGVDVHEPDAKGNVPIHVACGSNNCRAAELLVEYGADVNQLDGKGRAPLRRAIEAEREGLFRFLVEHGADVNLREETGFTPLLAAATKPPMYATMLLERGANVNTRGSGINWTHGWAPLHCAAHDGNLEVVALLLTYKVDVDARDAEGRTARQIAREAGHKGVDALLKRHGGRR